jgi:hypothetical protein
MILTYNPHISSRDQKNIKCQKEQKLYSSPNVKMVNIMRALGGGARDGGPGLFEDPKSFYVVEGINLD